MADARLRALVERKEILVAPGAFDMMSAKLVEAAGFEAAYMTGNGQSVSHLGLPDAGFITMSEMVERAHNMARAVKVPVIADADTGFGSLLSLHRAVQEFEDAGAAAIQIEDQVDPKKCGHTLGREVIEAREMARKLQVAADARRSKDFLIIARCDARTTLGLDEAIRRGKLYAQAGADVIFIESPESEEEFRIIGERLAGTPLQANMTIYGRSPLIRADRLQEMGFAIAIYPTVTWLPACYAMRQVLRVLKETGTVESVKNQMISLAEYHSLMGFPAVWEFEERYGLKDYAAQEAKYGART